MVNGPISHHIPDNTPDIVWFVALATPAQPRTPLRSHTFLNVHTFVVIKGEIRVMGARFEDINVDLAMIHASVHVQTPNEYVCFIRLKFWLRLLHRNEAFVSHMISLVFRYAVSVLIIY